MFCLNVVVPFLSILKTGFHKSMPCLATEIHTTPVKASSPPTWRNRRLQEFRRQTRNQDYGAEADDSNLQLRVASFNLLADENARTPFAKTVMFPYCSEETLGMSHRGPRLTAELLELDCDLFGLQEW